MLKKRKINFEDPTLTHYSGNQLRKIADYRFRKHLLSKWDGRCFISGKRLPPSRVHVAHYINRSVILHRWSEVNCHLVDTRSNTFDSREYDEHRFGKGVSKHHFEYRKALVEKYGEENIKKLEEPAPPHLMSKKDLIQLIEAFDC